MELIEKICQVDNPVTLSGQPMRFEELLSRMVEALGKNSGIPILKIKRV